MKTRIETTIEVKDPNRNTGTYKIVGHVIGSQGFSDDTTKDKTFFIIMADEETNSAMSITNNCERVATAVLKHPQFPNDPDRVIWAEYYPDRAFYGNRPQFKESFSLITFEWQYPPGRNPQWKAVRPVWSHTTRAIFEGLIKETFTITNVKID